MIFFFNFTASIVKNLPDVHCLHDQHDWKQAEADTYSTFISINTSPIKSPCIVWVRALIQYLHNCIMQWGLRSMRRSSGAGGTCTSNTSPLKQVQARNVSVILLCTKRRPYMVKTSQLWTPSEHPLAVSHTHAHIPHKNQSAHTQEETINCTNQDYSTEA